MLKNPNAIRTALTLLDRYLSYDATWEEDIAEMNLSERDIEDMISELHNLLGEQEQKKREEGEGTDNGQ